MPSQSETVSEKPHHYTYLKEFRTQQCPLFLQHKCTQHRPFVCFHWHFANQRRRRPTRKRDGTFNYSPDVYCTKYDETTGICPEGDDCPFLHRTAGDTERRYHLRYYKTCTCVYETDARGHCVKNGAHCAFAHGAADLRPPLYDVRELQAIDGGVSISESPLGSSLEKDRIINEDPRWNDTNYVLANYKTEPCKRPPRLCRQGYACPSFHNTRDRRRSPKKTKYRSTPCPNVKHGDDWGDPTQCESGDGCAYCHTRTEQQFHPEIYKSTKCNDMMQTGYCPRGPFCAFAHVEHEMTTQRDVSSPGETSLAAFVESALPGSSKSNCTGSHDDNSGDTSDKDTIKNGDTSNHKPHTTTNGNGLISSSSDPVNIVSSINSHVSYPEPIGKGRTSSMSSSVASDNGSNYPRAPGSEREDSHHSTSYQAKLRQQLQSIENDPLLDANEKRKRKQNLMLVHNINIGVIGTPPLSSSLCAGATAMSPHAASFYPAGDTVESVIGNALEEDLNLGEISLSSLDREMSRDNDNDTNSVCSSLSAGFPANSGYLGATSVPVTIPAGGYQRNSLGSLSQSPSSSPVGSLPLSYVQKQEQQIHDAALAFLSQPNPGKFSAPASSFSDYNSMSPRTNGSVSQSPMVGSGSSFGPHSYSDIHRLREELGANKAKLAQWEEGISQARGACEAWKREAEEACRRAKIAEEDRQQAIKQRDEAVSQMAKLKMELDQIRAATILNAAVASGAPFLQSLAARASEMESLPQNHMKPRQKHIEDFKMRPQQPQSIAMKCGICQEKDRSINILPCNHFVLCNMCISKCTQCPMCQAPTSQPGNFSLPM